MCKDKLVLPLSIILILLSGCIDVENEEEVIHYGYLEGIGENYVLTPVVLYKNSTFIEAEDYHIEEGKGSIIFEKVNGNPFLNITSFSATIRFEFTKEGNLSDIYDYSFSNSYVDPLTNVTMISIFYSGEGYCRSYTKIEVRDETSGFSWEVGPMSLISGWNELVVYEDNWIN